MKKTRAELAVDAAFVERLEKWMPTAPDNEIRRLLDPNNLVELYQAFGYAPRAWAEGIARMRAELRARECGRDGLRVIRGGATVSALSGKRKDAGPLPDKKTRALYTERIIEMIPKEESNRKIAKMVIEWAVDRVIRDPTGFGKFRVLRKDVLAKEAARERGEWAKARARRRIKKDKA